MAMERDKLHYRDYRGTIRSIYQREGLLGFYRGYLAALMGVTLVHGCAFFIFTKIKEWVRRNLPGYYEKWYVDFIIGVITSSGQFLAYPFDMVKKRMQGQGYLLQYGEQASMFGYRELLSKMWGEGIRSFYKGFTLNILKTPIALSTSWTVKNQLNRRLDDAYDL